MATELAIRTTEAVYIGGDTVYGAVYLNVSSPTSAYGIWIKFSGAETVYAEGIVTKCTKYLPSDNVVLFDFGGPIALGQYVFPFCKQLPRDLPASTEVKWSSSKADVVYFVNASLIGADNSSISQQLVIKQPYLPSMCEHNLSDSDMSSGDQIPQDTKVCHVRTFLPILTTQMKILSSLDKAEYVSGENLKVKLHMEVMGTVKPSVSYIAVQLLQELQELQLTSENRQETRSVDVSCDIRKISETTSGDKRHSGLISPERDPAVVIWDSGRLCDRDGSLFHKGFNELLIPLKERRGSALPATTKSHSFTLSYSVKVEILLQRNEPIVLKMPLHCVSQRPTEWQQWKPLDWLFECQMMSSYKSPYQVSDEILGSTKFSALPSFQVV